MRLLITGDRGYVGPCVVRHLRSVWPEARITGLDAEYFADCLLTSKCREDERAHEQIRGDVRDASRQTLAGTDAVVHLAGISKRARHQRTRNPCL